MYFWPIRNNRNGSRLHGRVLGFSIHPEAHRWPAHYLPCILSFTSRSLGRVAPAGSQVHRLRPDQGRGSRRPPAGRRGQTQKTSGPQGRAAEANMSREHNLLVSLVVGLLLVALLQMVAWLFGFSATGSP